MSENGVTRLLLIILVISNAQIGTPLECYVCTSVENSACTSSLSGIERSTCSLDETTESTLVPTMSTTISDSEITGSIATSDPTSPATDMTSTENPSSETTSSSDTSESTSETTAESTSSISDATTTEDSNSEETSLETSTSISTSTESAVSESVTPTETTTQEIPSSTDSGTPSNLTISSKDLEHIEDDEDGEVDVPKVIRVVRNADVAFACYTLTLIKDNVTVTDRGCAVRSSSICDNLNEEKYPGYNLTSCKTCTQDGCNSSPINLSGISSLFLPLIMFVLTR